MAHSEKDQLGMDEEILEDMELEEALEKRSEYRDQLAGPQVAYKEADDRAKALIEERLEIGDVARVGRFRVTREMKPGRDVSFTTEAKAGVSITASDE